MKRLKMRVLPIVLTALMILPNNFIYAEEEEASTDNSPREVTSTEVGSTEEDKSEIVSTESEKDTADKEVDLVAESEEESLDSEIIEETKGSEEVTKEEPTKEDPIAEGSIDAEDEREAINQIYLNGETGDDNNDGSSLDSPLKTFNKAKAIAEENKDIKEIIVSGTVPIEGVITLEGTSAKVIRADNFNDYLFSVESGKTASLKAIVIEGNLDNPNVEKSLIHVKGNKDGASATLNIQDKAVLRNNEVKVRTDDNDDLTFGGAILAENNSTVNMQGGLIEGNTSDRGGGICLEDSTLNISAGTIRNNLKVNHNKFQVFGGAVYTINSEVNMTGGLIEKNEATYGGGIFVDKKSKLAFSAGTIQNNKAKLHGPDASEQEYAAGGGICADHGSEINLSNEAKILKNHSDRVGGGISIGSNQPTDLANYLNMHGGRVEGNTAYVTGGGIFV